MSLFWSAQTVNITFMYNLMIMKMSPYRRRECLQSMEYAILNGPRTGWLRNRILELDV